MSVYHPSFNFLNKNSYDDFNLIVSHFDGDQGESDTWLGMDPIYSDSADGTRRIDYGAKFNSVATPKITVIKADGTDFTVQEVRQFLKWTTGSRKNSYLELCEREDDKWVSKFRLLGRTTKAYQQKLDARTIGLIIEFTTVSPFAYSPVISCEYEINGTKEIIIDHDTDDLDTLIGIDVSFNNIGGNSFVMYNALLDERTEVKNLVANETITLNSNGFIKSDKPGRIFGNDFNYVFPRFGYGADVFNVTGHGVIKLEYMYFIKIGDYAIDVDVSSGGTSCGGPIPGGSGNSGGGGTVVVKEILWSKIVNRPTTIQGYGITDAYTKDEVDALIKPLQSFDVEIDDEELKLMLEEVLCTNASSSTDDFAILHSGALGKMILGRGV